MVEQLETEVIDRPPGPACSACLTAAHLCVPLRAACALAASFVCLASGCSLQLHDDRSGEVGNGPVTSGVTPSAVPPRGVSAEPNASAAWVPQVSGGGVAGTTGRIGASSAPPPMAAESAQPGAFTGASCPAGFVPHEGTNTEFATADAGIRQFVVRLPPDVSSPRPVLVVLTGTVESTLQALTDSRLAQDLLPKGWIVLAPVRHCSPDAADVGFECDMQGADGWAQEAWNDGAIGGTSGSGERWWNDAGPDARFIQAMVRCAATVWPLDAGRLFVAGHSSGATLTNRLLTFQSDFWAGGMPAMGQWYIEDGNASLERDTTAIVEGRCCPLPELPARLGPMFVITSWGGEREAWPGLRVRADAQAGSNYFAAQPDVIHLACRGEHGYRWQPVSGFNAWVADEFYAHPKGSTEAPNNSATYPLVVPPPPPFACVAGRYVDLY